MKKKEMTRLINMVMLAEKTDPRITADKVKRLTALCIICCYVLYQTRLDKNDDDNYE